MAQKKHSVNISFELVLENTLESSLDYKEITPVNPKGNQSWIFIGRTDVEAETPILWSPDAKYWLIGKDPDAGKDWRREEKGSTEDEIVGWHHRLNGHEFEQALRVGDGQGSLACCSPWGCKELDMTEQLNWTETLVIFQEQQWRFSYFLYTSIRISHRNNHCLQILIEHLPKLFYSAIKSTSANSAAKSFQSCLTLCEPIDGSLPGSPVPGILQARTLEWVAISFSNAWKWKVKVKMLSRIQPSATSWTAAFLHPWDFPGKSTGVGCHCLLHSKF